MGNSGNSVILYFWGGLQIHCRWWLQPWNWKKLTAWKESYDQPRQHIKTGDITLPTKFRLVKAMLFPVVMYGCKSWTVKKAERWKIDASELWCWIILLGVPWTAMRSNQSIIKEISPGFSVEVLMLKLKHQYFGHLMQRFDSLEKTPMMAEIGGRRRGWQRMRWLDDFTVLDGWVWVNSGNLWWTGRPGMLGSQGGGQDWASELNWTSLNKLFLYQCFVFFDNLLFFFSFFSRAFSLAF